MPAERLAARRTSRPSIATAAQRPLLRQLDTLQLGLKRLARFIDHREPRAGRVDRRPVPGRSRP